MKNTEGVPVIDEKVIEGFNKIIIKATDHGGDAGGAYFAHPTGQIEEMIRFLKRFGLNEEYGITSKNGYLLFHKRKGK